MPEGTIVGGSPARVVGDFKKLAEKRYKHPKPSGKEEKVWKKFEKKHNKKSKGKKKLTEAVSTAAGESEAEKIKE